MKFMTLAALAGVFVTSAAFAQTASPQNGAPASDSNSAATTAQQPQGGQWVPPYGQPIAGKTRAEVYQELVHAEQDGQLAYLNSTLYAHH